jgi:ribosomal protein L19E
LCAAITGEPLNGKKAPALNSSEYEDVSQMETSNYVKKLVKSASVNLSHTTQSNARVRAISRIERDRSKKEDVAIAPSKVAKLKSKSMGSTVSKIVAAFSNGVPLA